MDTITCDDLILSGYQLYQYKREFRFSIDAVLLAHFGQAKKDTAYIDLGTGTGVIPHILVHRGATHVVGVDMNEPVLELAKKSVAHNQLENQIKLYIEDYMAPRNNALLGSFKGAYINPPYFEAGRGATSQIESVATALHEGKGSLEEISRAIKRYVQFGGYVWMIHRTERLGQIVEIFQNEGISIKRLRFVHSFHHSPSKLVLLEGRIGGKAGLVVEPPLYIYETQGQYTEEVKSWYGIK